MNNDVLKAIKDWCTGRFQTKGDYLTKVPEGYVTDEELGNAVNEMVTEEKLDNQYLGGIRLGKDENGNPGYYKYDEEAGADTLVPFNREGDNCNEFTSPFIPARINCGTGSNNIYQMLLLGNFQNFKKIKIMGRLSAKITTTSGSYTRTVKLYFSHQVKDENGEPVSNSAKLLELAAVTVRSTTESVVKYEKEIDVTNVWLPNYDEYPQSIIVPCPRFSISADNSSYVQGVAYLDKVVFCK